MLGPGRRHMCPAIMTGSWTPRWNSRRRRLLISAAALAGPALSNVGLVESANAATVSCSASSLVSAISLANITPGGGTVTLTSGCVYTLTSANNATDGGTGLPVISGKVTVQGNGATIARSTATGVPAFRLLDVAFSGNLKCRTCLTPRTACGEQWCPGRRWRIQPRYAFRHCQYIHLELVARNHRYVGGGDR